MFELGLGGERAATLGGHVLPYPPPAVIAVPTGEELSSPLQNDKPAPQHQRPGRNKTSQPRKPVGDMPDREAQGERDHAVDDVSNPSTEKRRWLRPRRRTSTSRSLA